MNKWTSVSESLPSDGQRVLIAAAGLEPGDRIHIGTRSQKDWFSDCGDVDFEVRFWMPLPEEPEMA